MEAQDAASFLASAPRPMPPNADDYALARIKMYREKIADRINRNRSAAQKSEFVSADRLEPHLVPSLPPKLAVCVECHAQYSPRRVEPPKNRRPDVIYCPGCGMDAVTWIDATGDTVTTRGRWAAGPGTVILDLLVHAGKVSMYAPFDGSPFVAVAWSSKRSRVIDPANPDGPTVAPADVPARLVERLVERDAEAKSKAAAGSVAAALTTIADVAARAAALGAQVTFQSHKHTLRSGVSVSAPSSDPAVASQPADFGAAAYTGDARYVVEVIARKAETTPGDPLEFHDVDDCVRCGGSHQRLAFWPLSHVGADGAIEGGAPDTHFAFCPANGQPVLMYDYREPLPKTEENAMDSIAGPGTITASKVRQTDAFPQGTPLLGADEMAFRQGRNAALDGKVITECPFSAGSERDAWNAGYQKGTELANRQ